MTPEDYKRITEAFLRLCELPPEERQDSLQLLKQQDPNFHDAVEKMLRLDDGDERFRSSIDETVRPANSVGHVMLSAMNRGDDASDVRYQLTRLHATGGMGRVWLARDNAMGRNVALKELKPETPVAPGIWNRFLNEAKVTGQLEHPGIVPVYEVDSGDAERPFYTMRFVKGQTLHEATKEFTKRRTTGRFSELELRELITALTGVANAIGYAHSRGVLHRDLKGQNVVLGDYGEVIVLDWGLACIVGSPVIDDDTLPVSGSGISDLTNAGQVIGTPAYMSPEQSRGLQDQMNAQTDVFGLGGILYEILAGQAPYNGTVAAETLALAQIGKVKPPRSLWADAPPALEAICLKAMSREQSHRYATAVEFADELRRWQADESVLAYPDPLMTRVNRWARRHKTLAATIAALTFAAVIALTISTILISSEQRRTLAAQARAEVNLAKAREAVQRMLTEVGDERLKNVPQMEKLRETLLQEALEFNKGFLLESEDPEVRKEAGLAYGDVARVYLMLGKSDESLNATRQGIEILTELHKSAPKNADYTKSLAGSLVDSARTHYQVGNDAEVETACDQALLLLKPLTTGKSVDDDVLTLIAGCQRRIGDVKARASDNDSAESWYLKAIETYQKVSAVGPARRSKLQNEADVRGFLGNVLRAVGRYDNAKQQFLLMLSLSRDLVEQQPENHEYRELLAQGHDLLGDVERTIGDQVVSQTHGIAALEIREQLSRDFPHIADYQYAAASGLFRVGISFARMGDNLQAEKYFLRGAEAANKLAASYPTIPTYRHLAAISNRGVGIHRFNTRHIEEARQPLLDAISQLQSLVAEFPENPSYRMDLSIALHPLGRCYQQTSMFAAGREVIARAITIEEALIAETADVVMVRHKLAQNYRLMGELLAAENDTAGGEEFLLKAIELHRQTASEFSDVAEHHRWVAVGLDKLAEFLLPTDKLDEAITAIDESITIRKRLIVENSTWFQPQVELPNCLLVKSKLLVKKDQPEAANAVLDESTAVSADLVKRFPKESNAREDLARASELKAQILDTAGKFDEALAEFANVTVIRRQHVADFSDEKRALNELRDHLADIAELQLHKDDHVAALGTLRESLSLKEAETWQPHLRAAELLTLCNAKQPDDATADLAIGELLLALKTGHPFPADLSTSDEFSSLASRPGWQTVLDFVANVKSPSPTAAGR